MACTFAEMLCHHGNRLVDDLGCAVQTPCGCRIAGFEWQPSKLAAKYIADDGRDFGDDPAFRFWLLEHDRILKRAFKTSELNAAACRLLWRDLGRADPVPKSLKIFLRDI